MKVITKLNSTSPIEARARSLKRENKRIRLYGGCGGSEEEGRNCHQMEEQDIGFIEGGTTQYGLSMETITTYPRE